MRDLVRARRILDLDRIPADRPRVAGPLHQIFVVKEELRLVDVRRGAPVDADDLELEGIGLAVLRPEERGLDRNPIAELPAETRGELPPDERAGPGVHPSLAIVAVDDELGVDAQDPLGVDRHVREEVLRVLIDAAEPGHVRHEPDPRRGLDLRQVTERERLDHRHLVDRQQAPLAGELDPDAEAGPDRHEEAEEEEGDGDREEGEGGADLPAHEVPPEEGKVLHAACASTSMPLSMWRTRRARSAASGSWVTMITVFS